MMQINYKNKSYELTTNTWKAFSDDMEVSVVWPEVMTPLTEIKRKTEIKVASMSRAEALYHDLLLNCLPVLF